MDTAVFRYLRGDNQDAFRLFNEVLELDVDHAQAALRLGAMYQNGEGVQKDKAKAAEMYQP